MRPSPQKSQREKGGEAEPGPMAFGRWTRDSLGCVMRPYLTGNNGEMGTSVTACPH